MGEEFELKSHARSFGGVVLLSTGTATINILVPAERWPNAARPDHAGL